jgi:hypothetical protein
MNPLKTGEPTEADVECLDHAHLVQDRREAKAGNRVVSEFFRQFFRVDLFFDEENQETEESAGADEENKLEVEGALDEDVELVRSPSP